LAIYTTIFRRNINKNSSRGLTNGRHLVLICIVCSFLTYIEILPYSQLNFFLIISICFIAPFVMSNFSQENLLAMKLSPIPYQPTLLLNNCPLAVPRPPHKRPSHRRGWQNALQMCNPSSMSLPSILTSNERSLFSKSDYLDLMLTDGIYRSTGVI